MESPVVVELEGVATGYDGAVILSNIDLQIRRGEIFGILGRSGCGKTTLLRTMVGLLPPLTGRVLVHGHDLYAASPTERLALLQSFGVTYQAGALFGSMTLLENVLLPLEEHTALPAPARRTIARMKLRMVGLSGFGNYLPEDLSGGMRKRAGVARALALDPNLLFFDEPSAGLDPVTSAELDKLIVRLVETLHITAVLVTHELPSIYSIVDRAVLLHREERTVIASGKPEELRAQREDPRVLRFFQRLTHDEEYESSTPSSGDA